MTQSRGYEWNAKDGDYDLKTHKLAKEEQLRLELVFDGASGRLRLPEEKPGRLGKRLPDGWYAIERLLVGDDVIEGVVSVGFMDRPRLHIDRRTGSIAFGDFKGDCDRMPTERKF